MTDIGFAAPGFEVFFNSQRAGVDDGLTQRLVDFINGTKQTLDCAIYDLRAEEVAKALAGVHLDPTRTLRLVYDASGSRGGNPTADPKPSGTKKTIDAFGLTDVAVPVHESGGHLMHDKFLIRDSETIWTGSANFTIGGLQLQDNNCLQIVSSDLVSAYQTVFDELHAKGDAATAVDASVSQAATVSTIDTTPFFSPVSGEGIETEIVDRLGEATKVRIMAFLISDDGILGALERFEPADADIQGVYDPGGMADVTRHKTDLSAFWFLQDDRFVAAHSRPFSKDRENDFMHNKLMILDDKTVITGSYNFSENAEKNDENLLVIESPEVAQAYTDYFDAVFTNAKQTAHAHAGHHG
jgi:phosphatidylserine/phosphatidylglycerophosphate/cardiolipin synthase-like enzyme